MSDLNSLRYIYKYIRDLGGSFYSGTLDQNMYRLLIDEKIIAFVDSKDKLLNVEKKAASLNLILKSEPRTLGTIPQYELIITSKIGSFHD